MNVLIVCDSVFGNTQKIADAMRSAMDSETVVMCRPHEVTASPLDHIDMLIVGSPTRAFHPTKPTTDFIHRLSPNQLKGVSALAFDTRIASQDVSSKALRIVIKLLGYAAKKIAKKLHHKRAHLLLQPEGFYVTGYEGPLKEGECARAAQWARAAIKLSQAKSKD